MLARESTGPTDDHVPKELAEKLEQWLKNKPNLYELCLLWRSWWRFPRWIFTPESTGLPFTNRCAWTICSSGTKWINYSSIQTAVPECGWELWTPAVMRSSSYDPRMILAGRGLRRSLVQGPAQSRVSSCVRLGCSGLYPVWAWKSPKLETAQPLSATCSPFWLSSWRKNISLSLERSTLALYWAWTCQGPQ